MQIILDTEKRPTDHALIMLQGLIDYWQGKGDGWPGPSMARATSNIENIQPTGTDVATLDTVVEKASQIVDSGDKQRVIDALKSVGAHKVSALRDDQLGDFMKALG